MLDLFRLMVLLSMFILVGKLNAQTYYGTVTKSDKGFDRYYLIKNCKCVDSVLAEFPLISCPNFSFSVVDSIEIIVNYFVENNHTTVLFFLGINKIKPNDSVEVKASVWLSSFTFPYIRSRYIYTKDGFLFMKKENKNGDEIMKSYDIRQADEPKIKKIFEDFDKM